MITTNNRKAIYLSIAVISIVSLIGLLQIKANGFVVDDLPSKDDLMGGNFKKLKDSKYNKIPGLKIKGNNSTQKYIINKFVTALNELKPKILELIEQEILNKEK